MATPTIVRTAKHIYFNLLSEGKTKQFEVVAKDGEVSLGGISFLGRWRCYCFFPLGGTIFERQCLRDIADFCEQETKKWREGIAAKREPSDGLT
jgi:hypothetical protein